MFLFMPRFIERCRSYQTLNVCAFTETFCPEAIARFEKKMGVKVNLTYVELDEQIYTKFKINEGEGYDVINLSDYMVHILANQGYLSKLDYSQLKNSICIDELFLHRLYDPENNYSVPHKWFMYGLVYDKDFFNRQPELINLDFIFKNPQDLYQRGLVKEPYKVCMLDSAIDSFFIASLYLLGHTKNYSEQDFKKVKELLMQQKQWVESYTLYSVEYFLRTNIIPIALTSSNFMRKLLKVTDKFAFTVPPEGGIWVIENLVIPQLSQKKTLAHQFIDFMISDEIAILNSNWYGWTSTNKKAKAEDDTHYKQSSHLLLTQDICNRLYIPLFSYELRAKIDDAWLEVGFV